MIQSRSVLLTGSRGRPATGALLGRARCLSAKAAPQLVDRDQGDASFAAPSGDNNYIKSHRFQKPSQQKDRISQQQQQQQTQQQQQNQAQYQQPVNSTTAQGATGQQYDELDLTFNNTRLAYKSKTLSELARNYLVLGLSSSDFLVRNNDKLMKLSRRVFGQRLFKYMMRATFYGQFVAGEDEREIVPVIKHLSSFGVKTILDYSAEEDVSEPPAQAAELRGEQIEDSQSPLRRYQQVEGDFSKPKPNYQPVARTYFYQGESQCEKNMEIFLKAIDAVAQTTGNTGFAAIKLTALGRPKLLMKLSKIIDYMRKIDSQRNLLPPDITLGELLTRFESLDQLTDISAEHQIEPLDEDDREMLANLMRRLDRIASYASQAGGARCMIDAEQTYMQPAITMIAMDLMRRHNKREAIIFNTYQCYLKSAYSQVVADLAMARKENFFFGAKLVRGAYMEQERERALKLHYEDPINPTFEATTQMYQQTLAYLMSEIGRELNYCSANGGEISRRISIMVASHNEETVRFAIEQMKRHGIQPEHRVICFGQLYGMCDHVSFTLGQSGYSVYKYTPYGPIEEVLPYLGRRATENHGFLSKLQRERSLLAKEIVNRLLTLRWFYKPRGGYQVRGASQ